LFTCTKHLHDHIISLRGEAWAHETISDLHCRKVKRCSVLQFVFSQRSDLKQADADGNNVLHIAAKEGNQCLCWDILKVGGCELLHEKHSLQQLNNNVTHIVVCEGLHFVHMYKTFT
jgi:ankyrin repeat protein